MVWDGVCGMAYDHLPYSSQVGKAFFIARAKRASVKRGVVRASRQVRSATRVATKATRGARTMTRN